MKFIEYYKAYREKHLAECREQGMDVGLCASMDYMNEVIFKEELETTNESKKETKTNGQRKKRNRKKARK